LLAHGGDLRGRGFERKLLVGILDADPGDVEFLQHLNHLGAIEIAERVGGDAQLDSVGRGLNGGGRWR
jgi:hypothetical protein